MLLYELLGKCNALLTDYSSVIIENMVMRNLITLVCNDMFCIRHFLLSLSLYKGFEITVGTLRKCSTIFKY